MPSLQVRRSWLLPLDPGKGRNLAALIRGRAGTDDVVTNISPRISTLCGRSDFRHFLKVVANRIGSAADLGISAGVGDHHLCEIERE